MPGQSKNGLWSGKGKQDGGGSWRPYPRQKVGRGRISGHLPICPKDNQEPRYRTSRGGRVLQQTILRRTLQQTTMRCTRRNSFRAEERLNEKRHTWSVKLRGGKSYAPNQEGSRRIRSENKNRQRPQVKKNALDQTRPNGRKNAQRDEIHGRWVPEGAN